MIRGLLLTCLAVVSALPLVAAEAPDPAAARRAIDALVASWRETERPISIGIMLETTNTAIETGAPAYNAGEIATCAAIYRHAAGALLELAPPEPDPAADAAVPEPLPPSTRRAVEHLRAAVTRADADEDPDARAWTLRFGFDSVQLEYRLAVARGQLRMQQGQEHFLRGGFEEARIAFADAVACAHQVAGSDPATLDATLRLAPLALGHAQFIERDFRGAARSLARGVAWYPEWPVQALALGDLFPRDPAAFASAKAALDEAVAERLDDVDLLFLQGYVKHFDGATEDARGVFRLVRQLDPEHRAAQRFLDAGAEPDAESAVP